MHSSVFANRYLWTFLFKGEKRIRTKTIANMQKLLEKKWIVYFCQDFPLTGKSVYDMICLVNNFCFHTYENVKFPIRLLIPVTISNLESNITSTGLPEVWILMCQVPKKNLHPHRSSMNQSQRTSPLKSKRQEILHELNIQVLKCFKWQVRVPKLLILHLLCKHSNNVT